MSPDRDSYPSLPAEYAAALAKERAEWKIASDAGKSAVDRVIAYARWLAAAERVKALAARMGGDDSGFQPCRP
jgi:hypothetical protein